MVQVERWSKRPSTWVVVILVHLDTLCLGQDQGHKSKFTIIGGKAVGATSTEGFLLLMLVKMLLVMVLLSERTESDSEFQSCGHANEKARSLGLVVTHDTMTSEPLN